MKKNNLILAASITAVILMSFGAISLFGIKAVSAQKLDNDYPSIIQNLSERFGLNAEDVQNVFEETKKERSTERLNNLVEDSVITEEQKDMIIAKHEELKEKIDSVNNKELTEEERRDELKQIHKEMKEWIEENDIPEEVVGFGMKDRSMGNSMENKGRNGFRFAE